MRNPLRKRLIRELKTEIGKYLVIFILLAGMIGMVSGFLVAEESIYDAFEESFDKYNIEDGLFATENEQSEAKIDRIEKEGISVFANFYKEAQTDDDDTIRIFGERNEVDIACLMQGNLPDKKGQIALDRMYANNNDYEIGDTITIATKEYEVVGLVALPDYSALFENNSDAIFDALKFGVALVSDEQFLAYKKDSITYQYSWIYDNKPTDDVSEKEMADELMESLGDIVSLEEFLPAYENNSIHYSGDDLKGDRAMFIVLLYILVAIVAFVFAITTLSTIEKEANVIGTLRASGYTKSELIRHFIAMPAIVTVVAAVVGNVLGYTYFEGVMANLYYESYSLVSYTTIFNLNAFYQTTLIPLIMMIVINYIILSYMLRISPLKFLKRDLRRQTNKKALPLSFKIPILIRFRIRIIMQNIPNYIVLFLGILFANLLLMFGAGLPTILDDYQEDITDNLLCKYQYVLKAPLSLETSDNLVESFLDAVSFERGVDTDNPDAEKFSIYTLKTMGDIARAEDISIYGIEKNSKYVKANISDDEIYVSSIMAEKYNLEAGDEITLKEPYASDEYTFKIQGVYDYVGAECIFMDIDSLAGTFDLGDGYFCGYFSNSEIGDISSKYISTVITADDLTKVSRQLDHSMGGMADMVSIIAMVIFVIIIYLLSKVIIDKGAQSISMTKILGYSNKEIASLYVLATTIIVIAFLIITLPIDYITIKILFGAVMKSEMTGWIPLNIGIETYVKCFVMGVASYAIVSIFEYIKIAKVEKSEALKNAE